MLITLHKANFGGAGLGKVRRMTSGMPSTGLVALFLMDSDETDADINTLADYSGRGNHATLLPGWTAAKQRSYGAEIVNVDGSIYRIPQDVNLPSRKMTVIQCLRSKIPGQEVNVFNNHFGSVAGITVADPSSGHNNIPALALNFSCNAATGKYQVFDGGADLIGQATLPSGGGPGYGDPGVVAMTIDTSLDRVGLHALGEASVYADGAGTALTDFYDGVSERGDMVIGCWPQGTRTAQTTTPADLYAVAIYEDVLTDEAVQEYMERLRAIAIDRGVTGF